MGSGNQKEIQNLGNDAKIFSQRCNKVYKNALAIVASKAVLAG